MYTKVYIFGSLIRVGKTFFQKIRGKMIDSFKEKNDKNNFWTMQRCSNQGMGDKTRLRNPGSFSTPKRYEMYFCWHNKMVLSISLFQQKYAEKAVIRNVIEKILSGKTTIRNNSLRTGELRCRKCVNDETCRILVRGGGGQE